MNWVVALGAMLFAAFALALIAPIVLHDPFAAIAAFLIGVFVGMLLENARSDRC
jgi:hypothetical protein